MIVLEFCVEENMSGDESSFEATVLDYLSQHRYVRRDRLIKDLMKSHPGETGYSEPSINRKLANMCKAGLILILKKKEDLERYEIEKESGNASYILAKNAFEMKKHYDYVFGKYITGDIVVKKIALKEITRYGMSPFLSPSQLDIMVLDLDHKDDDLINSLLELLYIQILNKGANPGNKEIFLEKLRNLLERYPEGHKNYSMLRRHIIWLLGYYNDRTVANDRTVIKQLTKDAKSGKLPTFQNDYKHKFTARDIEESKTELFDLELYLKEKKDTEAIRILDEIRKEARDKVNEAIEPSVPFEAVVGSPVSKPIIKGKIKGIKK